MKKIIAIVLRDIKSGVRDWLISYLVIAPILIASVLSMLIPGVSDTTINVVMIEKSSPEFVAHIENYAHVTFVDNQQELEERVLRTDDVFGIVLEGEKITVIEQGNEQFEMVTLLDAIINQYQYKDLELPVDIVFSSLGWTMSPLKLQGAIIVIVFTTILGGMLILLNIVEEKMSNTLSAIHVSPTSKIQLIIGKSLLGFMLAIFGAFASVLILNFDGIHYGMLTVSVFSIALISVIIGFSIGVVNNEPISAVASMKITFVPVLASIFGAMYLPDQWQIILYWSPFYWAYLSIHDILLNQATWRLVLLNSLWILLITGIVFYMLRPKIQRGLR